MDTKGKLFIFVIGALLAAGAIYYFVFFPKVLLERTFEEIVAAFEDENVNLVIDYFSSDYRDDSNMLKADVDDFLVFFFESRENIRCEFDETKMLVRGKKATVTVSGVITFETRAGQGRIDLRDSPLVLSFVREKNGWRVVEVMNGDTMIE